MEPFKNSFDKVQVNRGFLRQKQNRYLPISIYELYSGEIYFIRGFLIYQRELYICNFSEICLLPKVRRLYFHTRNCVAT
jgi:hypothetical protein